MGERDAGGWAPAEKIPVGVLGATGSVGQKFVELLVEHPWFEIVALAASSASVGRPYGEAARWLLSTPMPNHLAQMPVLPCAPGLPCRILFSALDAAVAGEIEEELATAGYIVVSNARNHRFDPDAPLLVPEVNADHLRLLERQRYRPGAIITNPNCSTTGLVIALKPLLDAFGVEAAHVVTLQAASGAGYPGVASLDLLDNVIPYISGEEEKMRAEPKKILGSYRDGAISERDIAISATCTRVAVLDGHTECISVKLRDKPPLEEIVRVWQTFRGPPQELDLPTAPRQPIHYFAEHYYPQPRLHRGLEGGMAVSVGRLRPCELFDVKFVALVHNTMRGAAGGAVLNAELLVRKGLLI